MAKFEAEQEAHRSRAVGSDEDVLSAFRQHSDRGAGEPHSTDREEPSR